MLRQIKAGATSQSVVIRIVDSTDGTPEEGVTSATAGLALWYRREGATGTAITESDLAATDSVYSAGGMIHLDDGYYRVDLPDAAVAAGVDACMIGGTVTGMVVVGCYVQLVGPDLRTDLTATRVANLDNIAVATSTAAAVADAVLDELLAGHTTADSLSDYVADIRGRTNLIGAAGITVTSPVGITNNLTLTQGDDYYAADSRSLDWSLTGSTVPELTSATVKFAYTLTGSGTVTTKTGSVVTATGDTKVVRCELAAADTAAMTVGTKLYSYDVEATLSNGHIVTLARGLITVLAQVTPAA